MNPHADPHITIAECRRIVATPPPDRGELRWHIQSVDAFNTAFATWQHAQTSCSKFLRDLPPGKLEKFDANHAEAVKLAQQYYAAKQSDSSMEEDTELPLTQCPHKSRRIWKLEWLMVLVDTFGFAYSGPSLRPSILDLTGWSPLEVSSDHRHLCQEVFLKSSPKF